MERICCGEVTSATTTQQAVTEQKKIIFRISILAIGRFSGMEWSEPRIYGFEKSIEQKTFVQIRNKTHDLHNDNRNIILTYTTKKLNRKN